jgi:hypothetical protein
LIEAINKLSTIKEWLDQDWMQEPVKLVGRWPEPMRKTDVDAGRVALKAWREARTAA